MSVVIETNLNDARRAPPEIIVMHFSCQREIDAHGRFMSDFAGISLPGTLLARHVNRQMR